MPLAVHRRLRQRLRNRQRQRRVAEPGYADGFVEARRRQRRQKACDLIVILARVRKQRAERLAGASLAPYLFGAQYTLPWYPAWLLPSLATSRKTLLARLVAVQSVLLLVVDPDRYAHIHGLAGNVVHGLKRFGIPVL